MASKDVQITVKVLDQASATLNKIASSAESSFGKIQGLLAGAGMAAPLALITKNTYAWAKAVNDLEDATGMAGEEASKLLAVGETVGLSGEAMQSAFIKMSKSVSAAQDSMAKAAAAGQESDDVYSRFGITVQDANKKLLPAEQILKNILEAHRNLPNGIEKTNMELEIFGKKGADLNDLLNLSGQEIDRLTEKYKKAGLIISSETSQAWEDLRNKTRELELTTKGLAVQIGSGLLPVLQEKVDWLNQVAESVSNLDENQRILLETTVKLGAEMGAFKILLAGLLPWWGKIAVAVGIAADAMNDYIDKSNTAAGYAYTMTGESNLIGNAKYGPVEVGKAGDWEGGGLATGQNKPKPARGGSDRRAASSGGGGAASNIDSLREKLANMLDDYNAKIMAETGTAFQGNAARLTAEIAKAGRELQEMAAKGLDVAAVSAKLEEYSKAMNDKYVKEQSRALQSVKNDTALINAETTDNYVAAAEAQYQATLLSIQKQVEERKKSSGNTTAVIEWEVAAVKQAEQKKAQAVIEGEARKHEQILNGLQYQRDVLGLSNQAFNSAYQQELQAFIDSNTAKLKNAQLTADERMRIEQKISGAVAQSHNLAGQNISTAWGEANRRMEAESYDYSARIVQAWQEMGSGISSGILNAIKGTGDGIKGIFLSITDAILKMWIDMITQMYIMKPMQNLMMGFMGGGGGGWTPGVTTDSVKFLGRAGGGYTPSGWTMVGELGPELVNFSRPGRVYTADQTREALSGGRGGNITVVQNISTPNAASFRQSAGQVASDAARGLNRNARRNG